MASSRASLVIRFKVYYLILTAVVTEDKKVFIQVFSRQEIYNTVYQFSILAIKFEIASNRE